MKLLFAMAMAFTLVTTGGCKKDTSIVAEVRINCRGTYLSWDKKFYNVCNLDKMSGYANGDVVHVEIEMLKDCNGSGSTPAICELNFPFESWVRVDDISK